MPRLSSRSKHEEFESVQARRIRVELNIADQNLKERRSSREFRTTVRKFRPTVRKFRTMVRKFRTGAKLPFLCTVHVYVDFLTYVDHLFGFLPNLPHCNSIFFWFFGILYEGLAIKSPKPSTVKALLH